MDCHSVRENINAYIDLELTEMETRLVAGHIEGCQSCRHEYDAYKSTREFIRANALVPSPAGLVEGIRISMEKERLIPARRVSPFRLRPVHKLLLAASLILALLGALTPTLLNLNSSTDHKSVLLEDRKTNESQGQGAAPVESRGLEADEQSMVAGKSLAEKKESAEADVPVKDEPAVAAAPPEALSIEGNTQEQPAMSAERRETVAAGISDGDTATSRAMHAASRETERRVASASDDGKAAPRPATVADARDKTKPTTGTAAARRGRADGTTTLAAGTGGTSSGMLNINGGVMSPAATAQPPAPNTSVQSYSLDTLAGKSVDVFRPHPAPHYDMPKSDSTYALATDISATTPNTGSGYYMPPSGKGAGGAYSTPESTTTAPAAVADADKKYDYGYMAEKSVAPGAAAPVNETKSKSATVFAAKDAPADEVGGTEARGEGAKDAKRKAAPKPAKPPLKMMVKVRTKNAAEARKLAIKSIKAAGGKAIISKDGKIILIMPPGDTLTNLNNIKADSKGAKMAVPEKLLSNEAKDDNPRTVNTEIIFIEDTEK